MREFIINEQQANMILACLENLPAKHSYFAIKLLRDELPGFVRNDIAVKEGKAEPYDPELG